MLEDKCCDDNLLDAASVIVSLLSEQPMTALGRLPSSAVSAPLGTLVKTQSSVSMFWILVHASLFCPADYGAVLRFAPVPI